MKSPLILAPLVILLSFTPGCQKQVREPMAESVRVPGEIEAVRQADGDWLKSVSDRSIDRVLEFYTDDAVWLVPSVPTMTGKDAIREFWEKDFTGPDYALAWEPAKIEVSQSGDLAYSLGTWSAEIKDEEGNTVPLAGKYVVVWKKTTNETWKVAVDIHND